MYVFFVRNTDNSNDKKFLFFEAFAAVGEQLTRQFREILINNFFLNTMLVDDFEGLGKN